MRGKEKKEIFKTPLGWAGLTVSDQGICRIVLPRKQKQDVQRELETYLGANCAGKKENPPQSPFPDKIIRGQVFKGGHAAIPPLAKGGEGGFERMVQKATDILRNYFSGERVLFDLPLDMRYYTRFQKAVWRAAVGIPYGETRSYAWVAKKIGNPRAVRAVGQALGANPVPIIIPCHRVIGSSGKLCGFAGGLTMKRKLLELEAGKVARRA